MQRVYWKYFFMQVNRFASRRGSAMGLVWALGCAAFASEPLDVSDSVCIEECIRWALANQSTHLALIHIDDQLQYVNQHKHETNYLDFYAGAIEVRHSLGPPHGSSLEQGSAPIVPNRTIVDTVQPSVVLMDSSSLAHATAVSIGSGIELHRALPGGGDLAIGLGSAVQLSDLAAEPLHSQELTSVVLTTQFHQPLSPSGIRAATNEREVLVRHTQRIPERTRRAIESYIVEVIAHYLDIKEQSARLERACKEIGRRKADHEAALTKLRLGEASAVKAREIEASVQRAEMDSAELMNRVDLLRRDFTDLTGLALRSTTVLPGFKAAMPQLPDYDSAVLLARKNNEKIEDEAEYITQNSSALNIDKRLDPQLSVVGSYVPFGATLDGVHTKNEWALQGRVTVNLLPSRGQRLENKTLELNLKRAHVRHTQALREVETAVQKMYISLQRQSASMSLARNNVALTQELYQIAQENFMHGSITRTNLDDAFETYESAIRELESLTTSVILNRLQILQICGRLASYFEVE